MRPIILTLVTCFASLTTSAQSISSVVEIVTVFSQNEKFYLKSTPFDNESPSLPGITHVFANGSTAALYTLPRAFDSVDGDSNNLILSDDGETIFYLISWSPEEDKDGLKSISIYKRGELVKSYTASEITGCDLNKERCDLEYSNYEEVVDREKSNWGTGRYKKAFKPGVSEQEKFLSDFAIFSFGNFVYLTDSKKKIHRFDLTEARYVDSRPFIEMYHEIKSKGRFVKTEVQSVNAPMYPEFPPLRSGSSTKLALGRTLGMVPYNIIGTADKKYKRYGFTVSGYLKRDGNFELTDIDSHDGLPKDKIAAFFSSNKFVTTLLPAPVDRWLLKEEYFFFRKADPKIAIKERREERRTERVEYQKRLVAETVGGRYIPKDLGDAFDQLDKELPEITRKEMAALLKRDDMIKYHMGLGMWMRNNWGLWGGSRLQKYFSDKGIAHPDNMSSVILFYYWDWLQGKKDLWKEWEGRPKSVFNK